MLSFNELLVMYGITPRDVTLLRHTGQRGLLNLTPFDLWQKRDGSFERYQQTQPTKKAKSLSTRYWASFVGEPAGGTLFIGIYEITKGVSSDINWLCPMTGLPPGQDRGRTSDLYHMMLTQALDEHREAMHIDWGEGYVAWVQSAHRNNKNIIEKIELGSRRNFLENEEGQLIWTQQRSYERDARVSNQAFERNLIYGNGTYKCEACSFSNTDRGMFDAHHVKPLLCGPRTTRSDDLVILCPTCHRRAHRGENRMLPYDLNNLKDWNLAGRP